MLIMMATVIIMVMVMVVVVVVVMGRRWCEVQTWNWYQIWIANDWLWLRFGLEWFLVRRGSSVTIWVVFLFGRLHSP
jgi:hypothetical protein